MSDEITQEDLDHLSDIIWWIKGYMAATDANRDLCPFSECHHDSLLKFRRINPKDAS